MTNNTKPTEPLCERCLKLQRVTPAVTAVAVGGRDDLVSLCAECAGIVESDGEIKGFNESGYPLDPTHPWYKGP